MIAIYQQNPNAFGGNINFLRAGSTRLPESVDLDGLATTVANAEVRRQTDEWQDRAAQGGQLRLLPPSDTPTARANAGAATVPSPVERATPPPPAATPAPTADGAGDAANGGTDDRLIALRNDQLQNLDRPRPRMLPTPRTRLATRTRRRRIGRSRVESEPLFTDELKAPPPPPNRASRRPRPDAGCDARAGLEQGPR